MLRALTVSAVAAVALAVAPAAQAKRERGCAGGSCTTRTAMQYAVIAHPDDEFSAWGAIQNLPQTYTVFVSATHGEMTRSCMRAEESKPAGDPESGNGTFVEGINGSGFAGLGLEGPYRYQGPNSPVGEPDKGEREPFGNPWQGQGTTACRIARLASWHWFLDHMGQDDRSLPDMGVAGHPMDDDDYVGRRCARRLCADAWVDEDGARIAFDLGDGNVKSEEVRDALAALHRHRRVWRLPRLPVSRLIAGAFHYEGGMPGCTQDAHSDHAAVHEALFADPPVAAARVGATCAADERHLAHPGPPLLIDPVTLVRAMYVDPVTEQRIGHYTVDFGWLWDTYSMIGSPLDRFWRLP